MLNMCFRALPLWAAVAPCVFALTPDEIIREIRVNDLVIVQQACADKAAVNGADARGTTPLHFAAAYGNIESVRLLVGCGADVNARNTMDATPLILAAPDPEKVKLLLQAGADPNLKTKSGRTALAIAASVPEGIASVRALLDKGADVNATGERGDTPILNAALTGDLETVRLLLARGAKASAPDEAGFNVIHGAASHTDVARLKLLLSCGADVNAANSKANVVRHGPIALNKMTPLILLAPHGTAHQVRTLLAAGAKVNVRDDRGLTPLMAAVASENQNANVIRQLIAAGADVNATDGHGESVLDWARKFNYPSTLRILEKSGAKGKPPVAPVVLPASESQTARTAVDKGMALLRSSSTEFFKESGCVGCHHQPLLARTSSSLASFGFAPPPNAKAEVMQWMTAWRAREPALVQFLDIGGGVDAVGSVLAGFAAAEIPANSMTDAAVNYVAGRQNAQGSWTSHGISRAPSEESEITRTTYAIRALRAYGWPARQQEFEQRIARARRWLLRARPRTSYERADRLLGLHWSGASAAEIAQAARELLREQKPDGGWAQNSYLHSDAYGTGVALHALRESRILKPTDPVYRSAVDFLLKTQGNDGSWHVRSRSPKFQPYFQSGFPHEHDQWISVMATAYAVMAIAPTAL